MFEHQISQLRRSLGLEQDESRSRWLAPIAVAAAGIGGVVALVVRRLRRQPQSGQRTDRAQQPAAQNRSGPAAARNPRTRKSSASGGRKASSASTTGSGRTSTGSRSRPKASSGGEKRSTARMTRATA